MSGIPQIEKKHIDFYVQGTELLRVRGHPGFAHPGACFREVNNLKCAQRSGVALQAEENGKKGTFPRAKGTRRNHP